MDFLCKFQPWSKSSNIRALRSVFFSILSALLPVMGCLDVVGVDKVVKVVDDVVHFVIFCYFFNGEAM